MTRLDIIYLKSPTPQPFPFLPPSPLLLPLPLSSRSFPSRPPSPLLHEHKALLGKDGAVLMVDILDLLNDSFRCCCCEISLKLPARCSLLLMTWTMMMMMMCKHGVVWGVGYCRAPADPAQSYEEVCLAPWLTSLPWGLRERIPPPWQKDELVRGTVRSDSVLTSCSSLSLTLVLCLL